MINNPMKIEELKKCLVQEEDLLVISQRFMDDFGDHEDFLKLGEKVEHEELMAILKIVGSAYPVPVKLLTSCVIQVDENFYHGPMQYDIGFGNFFYFQDIDMGLATVTQFNGENYFSRFSVKMRVWTDPPK